MLEEEFTENTLEETTYFKEKGCCVCINVFAKCDKDHSWRKENPCKDKKDDCCVCINVFVECDKDHPWGKVDFGKDKKDDCSVCINVFAEDKD